MGRALWVAGRIIRMFEFYGRFVDPESIEFVEFLKERLKDREGEVEKLPYVELYGLLKPIIEEYAKRMEAAKKT